MATTAMVVRLGAGSVLAFAGGALGGSVTYSYGNGVPMTTGLVMPGVTGADLAGASVLVTFIDGSTDLVSIGATGADAGGAFGLAVAGWSLDVAGATGAGGDGTFTDGLWTLTNLSGIGIKRVQIDATGADAVFDTSPFGAPMSSMTQGWIGSEQGFNLVFEDWAKQLGGDGQFPYDVLVEYVGCVGIGDDMSNGLYRSMSIDFGLDSLAPGASMVMVQDVDGVGGLEQLVLVPLPTPAALAAAGGGLLLLGRRRSL